MGRFDYSDFPILLDDYSPTKQLLLVTNMTYARGNYSLEIRASNDNSVTRNNITDIINPAILTPSIHRDYEIIDDFSSYNAGFKTLESAGWGTEQTYHVPHKVFYKEFETERDYSSFGGISLWGKSDYNVCLYFTMQDKDGNFTPISKIGFLHKKWHRMDTTFSGEQEVEKEELRYFIDNNYADLGNIKRIYIAYDCEPGAIFHIDEIIVFGFDSVDKNITWIKLLITDMSTAVTGRTTVADISGYHGDVVHPDGAISMRGKMSFKTGHAELDNDVKFINNNRRIHTKLFLRVGGDGWPIYITSNKQKPKESMYGIRNDVSIEFIEAS
jgi:hypothetical protein